MVAAADTSQKTVRASGPLVLAALDDAGSKIPSKSTGKENIREESSGRVDFRDLDAETELVLKKVLNLGSDLAVIDARENSPSQFQLFVLVTLEPTNLFELDLIELRLDNKVVAAHYYTDNDVSAMSKGGGHQLYLANLPAGRHELVAKMSGKIPRDPDYRRETRFKFISGATRTVIELQITGEASKGFPNIAVREWN